jgi:hypothetical protein
MFTALKGNALALIREIDGFGFWSPDTYPTIRNWRHCVAALEQRRLVVQREDGAYIFGGPGYDAARAAAIMVQTVCAEAGRLTVTHYDVARRLGVIPTAARLALSRARDLGWVALTSRRRGAPMAAGTWSPIVGAEVPRG